MPNARTIPHQMTQSAVATATDLTPLEPGPPTATALRVPTANGVKQVSGKLKRALDLMVYGDETGNCHSFLDAARKVGYSAVSMRKALERAHVQRYLREQKQVFRSAASAQNIHRAVQIRDQDDNRTAAVQAIKYLDGIAENEAGGAGSHRVTPGVVVHVNVNRAPSSQHDGTIIEVNPVSDGT
jgi:hypothetical protein